VAPYVGEKDIAMLYSVVDIAGLNRVSRRILGNGAGAMCGMLEAPADRGTEDRPLVAATMFGVTTPCVQQVRSRLENAGYEVLIFHATGSGGRAMENLIDGGYIAGVADVTTTEWCDELVGGILSAGPSRLEAAGRVGIPQVVSLGALDMVNFGGVESVPDAFRNRKLHAHNPHVTLMRTTPAECRHLGRVIAEKLNMARGPTTLLIPLRGVSAMDAEGQPFHDAEADEALFAAVREHIGEHIELVELDLHINDPEFADRIADSLLDHLGKDERGCRSSDVTGPSDGSAPVSTQGNPSSEQEPVRESPRNSSSAGAWTSSSSTIPGGSGWRAEVASPGCFRTATPTRSSSTWPAKSFPS
jgi:uncharacterized protein (UPF0261 family)